MIYSRFNDYLTFLIPAAIQTSYFKRLLLFFDSDARQGIAVVTTLGCVNTITSLLHHLSWHVYFYCSHLPRPPQTGHPVCICFWSKVWGYRHTSFFNSPWLTGWGQIERGRWSEREREKERKREREKERWSGRERENRVYLQEKQCPPQDWRWTCRHSSHSSICPRCWTDEINNASEASWREAWA